MKTDRARVVAPNHAKPKGPGSKEIWPIRPNQAAKIFSKMAGEKYLD